MDKKQRFDAEDAGDEINTNCSKKRIWIATGVVSFTLDNICGMFCNFISDGQAMYICNIPGTKPIDIMYVEVMIHFTLGMNTITWFNTKNSAAHQ